MLASNCFFKAFDVGHALVGLDRDLAPLAGVYSPSSHFGDLRSRPSALPGRRRGRSATALQPAELRSMIACSSSRSFASRSISALDRQRAFVLVDAAAREHAHLDDRAGDPGGRRSEVSRTSEAFSPKMARSSFSSGVIGDSPFGVTLPTRMSPGFTSAPI